MSQPATRLYIVPVVLSLLTALPIRGAAQDRFEIEVYPYETAARGEWELETHLNYTQVGTTAFDGRVADALARPRTGDVAATGAARVEPRAGGHATGVQRQPPDRRARSHFPAARRAVAVHR